MTNPEVFQSPPVYTIRCDKCWSNFSPIPHWKAHEITSFARCKPSHIQILQAKDALVNEEAEIRRYDAEIKRLNRIIKKLKAEQSLLRKQLAVHRSWIAPIQQLPSEILMEIFQYACLSEDYTLSVTSRTKEIRSLPLTISCVSSRWGELVKGQPNLWTSISVDLYRHRRDICPLLRSFLENSKQKPLSIEFRDSEFHAWTLHCAESDYQTCHLGMRGVNVFSLLMEESYRIVSLSAQISWEILENEQLNNFVDSPSNFPCRFPILRELHSFQDPGFDDDDFDLFEGLPQWFVRNGLSAAPRLRVLSLHALSPDNPLPYNQLTRLELLWDDDPEYLLEILSNSPCLEELNIQQFRGSIGFDEIQCDPVKLRSLRSLIIGVSVMGVPSIDALFSTLTLPFLRTLEIRHIADSADTVLAPIHFSPGAEMLSQCSDTLEKLSLSYSCYIGFEDIMETLETCTNLVDLQIRITPSDYDDPLHNRFLKALTTKLMLRSSPLSGELDLPLIPKLQRLFVHMKSPLDPGDTTSLLVRMVESRASDSTNTVTPPREVVFSFGDMDVRDPSQVHDCRDYLYNSLQARIAALEESGTIFLIEWSSKIPVRPRVPMYTSAESEELDSGDEV